MAPPPPGPVRTARAVLRVQGTLLAVTCAALVAAGAVLVAARLAEDSTGPAAPVPGLVPGLVAAVGAGVAAAVAFALAARRGGAAPDARVTTVAFESAVGCAGRLALAAGLLPELGGAPGVVALLLVNGVAQPALAAVALARLRAARTGERRVRR
ncbi:hypothetical protein GCM10009678_64670 [Actinomadura kijaniata]|uniref:hypothetical protein n=1 Tax=Actinomadura kijaniata TaxID=46161 RepID=UPI002FE74C68